METTSGVRFYKIPADVFFVPAHDGVWLRNNQDAFSIKGNSSYRLIRFLFAKLDGTRTIDAICSDLDPKQRRANVSTAVRTRYNPARNTRPDLRRHSASRAFPGEIDRLVNKEETWLRLVS